MPEAYQGRNEGEVVAGYMITSVSLRGVYFFSLPLFLPLSWFIVMWARANLEPWDGTVMYRFYRGYEMSL